MSFDGFVRWLHLLAMAFWLGPQALLFLAVVPATRSIPEPRLRAQVMGLITRRFGVLGGASLFVLLLTGLWQAVEMVPSWSALVSTVYGRLLLAKGTLGLLMAALTALHSFVLGPRLIAATAEGSVEVERLRRLSVAASAGAFLLSLVVVLLATLLFLYRGR
jgi:putative copper export protein